MAYTVIFRIACKSIACGSACRRLVLPTLFLDSEDVPRHVATRHEWQPLVSSILLYELVEEPVLVRQKNEKPNMKKKNVIAPLPAILLKDTTQTWNVGDHCYDH